MYDFKNILEEIQVNNKTKEKQNIININSNSLKINNINKLNYYTFNETINNINFKVKCFKII